MSKYRVVAMTSDLFERARVVSALDVAIRAGIDLRQKGGRYWACCPLHGEKTASFMVDEAGAWHCFGCGRGGDGISLYAALHGVSQRQAARALVGAPMPARGPTRPSARSVMRNVCRWKEDELKRLYGLLEACRRRDGVPDMPDDERYSDALVKSLRAEMLLLQLIDDVSCATPTELLQVMKGDET